MLSHRFMELGADAPLRYQSSFSKNREGLCVNEKALALFPETLLAVKEVKPLLINSHVSMDGGLLQAGTSHAPPSL